MNFRWKYHHIKEQLVTSASCNETVGTSIQSNPTSFKEKQMQSQDTLHINQLRADTENKEIPINSTRHDAEEETLKQAETWSRNQSGRPSARLFIPEKT